MRRLRSAALLTTAALAAGIGAAGCTTIEDLLGTGGGGSQADRLELNAIELTSDHPIVVEDPAGAAIASDGAMVRFGALWQFLNIDDNDALVERSVTSAVLWETNNPALGFPSSDGRLLVLATGAAIISVRTPASGDVPEVVSNSIALTVLTAGTGS